MDEAYRGLFEQATCGMVVVDRQGAMRAVNPAAAQVLGGRPNELAGRSFTEFLPAHQVTAFLEKLALLPSLGRFQIEAMLRLGQSSVGVMLDVGVLRWNDEPAALMFLREATPGEEAERNLLVVRKALLTLAEHRKSAFFLLRTDGRIERLPEPLPGTDVAVESPSWAWRVLHRQEMRDLLSRVWGGERILLEPTWYLPDDWERDANAQTEKGHDAQLLRLEFLPLQLPGEAISRVLVSIQDCTDERLAAERERAAERETSLALFAGALFQELNAYLGVIMAQASALRLSAAPGRLAPPAVGSILDAAQEAAAVLRRCSEAGVEEEWGALELGPCVLDAARMLSHELAGRVDVQTVEAPGLPPIRGSARLLRAMILAFGRQAAVHMPGGGRIRMETRCVSGTTPVAPVGAELSISDTGLGVAQNYSTQPGGSLFPGGGSGGVEPLGLTFARAIVQRHRGDCEASNVPGQGTTWRIRLPGLEQRPSLSGPLPRVGKLPQGEEVERPHLDGYPKDDSEAAEAEEVISERSLQEPPRRGRILFADDEDNILQYGREILRLAGYEAVVAADGQEAFEHFQRNPASYALVILDAYMPRLGGLETYLRMQAVRSDLPVLFVSGFVRGASRTALLSACPGRAQVLLKPFTDTDLLAAIEKLLEAQSGA